MQRQHVVVAIWAWQGCPFPSPLHCPPPGQGPPHTAALNSAQLSSPPSLTHMPTPRCPRRHLPPRWWWVLLQAGEA